MAGYGFRGRRLPFDPDRRAVEQERQRWVMEKLTDENAIIQELTVDPDRAYSDHHEAFVQTGNPEHLRLMLEYVR
jgi:hypothetical protein